MKTLIVTTLFGMMFDITVLPQAKVCNLNLIQSPALRGVQLQMSEEEVAKALVIPVAIMRKKMILGLEGEGKIYYPRFGTFEATVYEDINKMNFKSLKDLNYFVIEFFEKKVYRIYINYKSPVDFDDFNDFLSVYSEQQKLPNSWTFKKDEELPNSEKAVLNCQSFQLEVKFDSVTVDDDEEKKYYDDIYVSVTDVKAEKDHGKALEVFHKEFDTKMKKENRERKKRVFKP